MIICCTDISELYMFDTSLSTFKGANKALVTIDLLKGSKYSYEPLCVISPPINLLLTL